MWPQGPDPVTFQMKNKEDDSEVPEQLHPNYYHPRNICSAHDPSKTPLDQLAVPGNDLLGTVLLPQLSACWAFLLGAILNQDSR